MSTRQPKPKLSDSAQAALDAYHNYLSHEQDLRPATVRNYLSDVQQFMAWFEQVQNEHFALDRITTPTLTHYRRYLQKDLQRKPTTINRYLVSLKGYFAWLTERQAIARNPALAVKLVQEVQQAPHHMSDTQESALLAAVQRGGDVRDRVLITLMLHTGLRVGELCHLQWQHVVIQSRSGHLKIWGKRNKYREVPLNSTARQALQELRQSHPMPSPDEQRTRYVFQSIRTGDRLTPRAVGFIIKKYAVRAGLPDLRPHELRHRFGYRMAQTTALHRLAQIMGHDSLDTTMIYTQPTQHDLQAAVEDIAWE